MNKYFTKNKSIYCPYIMAWWPNEIEFFSIIDIFIDNWAKIIEIWIPFSDPSADWPVLTIINHKMSENNKSFYYYLEIISKVKNKYPDIWICVMSYLNPVFQYWVDKFFEFLSKNNIDWFLIPDLPIEEYEFLEDKIPSNIKNIMVISDNLSDEEIKNISNKTKWYLYVLSSISITWTMKNYQEKLENFIKKLKNILWNNKKLVVWFWIKNKDDIDFLNKINVDWFIIWTKIAEEYQIWWIKWINDFHKNNFFKK